MKKIFRTILYISMLIFMTGCMFTLQPAGSAQVRVSASQQMSAASEGFFGTLRDIQRIEVIIHRDTIEIEDITLENEDEVVFARLNLTNNNDWTGVAESIPTLTPLRFTATAYGPPGPYVREVLFEGLSSDEVDNLFDSESEVVMFSGANRTVINSGAARVGFTLTANRNGVTDIPRISKIDTNLSGVSVDEDLKHLRVTFNPTSISSERWWYRLVDENRVYADRDLVDGAGSFSSSFGYIDLQAGSSEENRQIFFEYLFPEPEQRMATEDPNENWRQIFWMEVINPQHNRLHRSFVINRGSGDTTVTESPLLTISRIDDEFNDFVSFTAKEQNAETSQDRILWIVLPSGSTSGNWAVYGDIQNNLNSVELTDLVTILNQGIDSPTMDLIRAGEILNNFFLEYSTSFDTDGNASLWNNGLGSGVISIRESSTLRFDYDSYYQLTVNPSARIILIGINSSFYQKNSNEDDVESRPFFFASFTIGGDTFSFQEHLEGFGN